MGVSEGVCDDGCGPDDMTAFKRTIALSGLSRLLQSRLGEWGEAAAAATDCASFASACCCKRLWYCSEDSPNCIMTNQVQEHHDSSMIFYQKQERLPPSTRAGGWGGDCELLRRPVSRRRGACGGRRCITFQLCTGPCCDFRISRRFAALLKCLEFV
jgi:hypothetical protein